jgi:hypothetical protein
MGLAGATGPAGGVSNSYTTSGTEVTASNATTAVTGSSVLYLLSDGVTATLPLSTTVGAGQIIVLVDNNSAPTLGNGATTKGSDVLIHNDGATGTITQGVSLLLVSAGNGRWFEVN